MSSVRPYGISSVKSANIAPPTANTSMSGVTSASSSDDSSVSGATE